MNRRRVCGKGWHIDIGPGFDLSWERTLNGHPYQGVVMLVLLSDWEPGLGGTVLASGSQDWVRSQIKAAEGVGAGAGAGASDGASDGAGAGAGAGVGVGAAAAAAAETITDDSDRAATATPSISTDDAGDSDDAASTSRAAKGSTVCGKGLPHKVLNQMCIDHMLRLARSERIWIPLDENAPSSSLETVAAAAPPPPPSEEAEQGR